MFIVATPELIVQAAQYLRQVDTELAKIITNAGLPTITAHNDYYQSLVTSIISQQLSVKAAATIEKRFRGLFAGVTFPTPSQIIETDIDTLRSVGLSGQKSTYIQDLAVKVEEGTVHFDHLDTLSNDEIIEELTKIKGVGVWTVHMFLIFCMGRLDVLPTGDLGIKNGIYNLYKLPEKPTPERIDAHARKYSWHPYESVASWYIWHSLDNNPATK